MPEAAPEQLRLSTTSFTRRSFDFFPGQVPAALVQDKAGDLSARIFDKCHLGVDDLVEADGCGSPVFITVRSQSDPGFNRRAL